MLGILDLRAKKLHFNNIHLNIDFSENTDYNITIKNDKGEIGLGWFKMSIFNTRYVKLFINSKPHKKYFIGRESKKTKGIFYLEKDIKEGTNDNNK